MATWKNIRSGIERTANKAIKKTGELADSASMRVKLKSLDVKLSGEFEKLGRLTYKQIKTSKSQAEEIAPVLSNIDSIRAEMKLLRDKIAAMKAEKEHKSEEDFTADTGSTEENVSENTENSDNTESK